MTNDAANGMEFEGIEICNNPVYHNDGKTVGVLLIIAAQLAKIANALENR